MSCSIIFSHHCVTVNKLQEARNLCHVNLDWLQYSVSLNHNPLSPTYRQESGLFRKYRGVYSNNNIDLYNSFLSSCLTGTNIKVWDSNIPFSISYNAQCAQRNRNSFDMLWNCNNPLHTGYVMVEEYANIFLNEVCNSFIDQLDTSYCWIQYMSFDSSNVTLYDWIQYNKHKGNWHSFYPNVQQKKLNSTTWVSRGSVDCGSSTS